MVLGRRELRSLLAVVLATLNGCIQYLRKGFPSLYVKLKFPGKVIGRAVSVNGQQLVLFFIPVPMLSKVGSRQIRRAVAGTVHGFVHAKRVLCFTYRMYRSCVRRFLNNEGWVFANPRSALLPTRSSDAFRILARVLRRIPSASAYMPGEEISLIILRSMFSFWPPYAVGCTGYWYYPACSYRSCPASGSMQPLHAGKCRRGYRDRNSGRSLI